jgi:ribosomal protein S18 acetylase RimI-like enzyme
MAEFLLRRATPRDALALACLTKVVFTTTYGAVLEHEILQRYLATHASPTAMTDALSAPDVAYTVALTETRLIGFSKVAVTKAPTAIPCAKPIELAKLYVDPAYHGTGVAGQLLAHTLAMVQDRGHTSLWLCVWKANARALAFYRKWSFAVVGEQPVYVESVAFDDWVMMRPLASERKG